MSKERWLSELKPGDTVLSGEPGWTERVAKVARVTATQIIVGNSRNRRKDGKLCGAWSHSRDYLRPASPEDLKMVKVRKACGYLTRLDLRGLDHDTVIELAELVRERIDAAKAKATNEQR